MGAKQSAGAAPTPPADESPCELVHCVDDHHVAEHTSAFIPEEGRIEYLTVEPDDIFYRLLCSDLAAASRSLQSFTSTPARTISAKVSLTRKFCAVIKYATERLGEKCLTLAQHGFLETALKVACDENNYSLKRTTQREEDGEVMTYCWLDHVSVVRPN